MTDEALREVQPRFKKAVLDRKPGWLARLFLPSNWMRLHRKRGAAGIPSSSQNFRTTNFRKELPPLRVDISNWHSIGQLK